MYGSYIFDRCLFPLQSVIICDGFVSSRAMKNEHSNKVDLFNWPFLKCCWTLLFIKNSTWFKINGLCKLTLIYFVSPHRRLRRCSKDIIMKFHNDGAEAPEECTRLTSASCLHLWYLIIIVNFFIYIFQGNSLTVIQFLVLMQGPCLHVLWHSV